MAIKNIEIQDDNGTVYYPHTDSSVIKHGDSTVGEVLSDKVNKSSIANNVVTTSEGLILDARQGKILQDQITTINNKLTWKQVTTFTTLTASKTQYTNVTETVSEIVGARKVYIRFVGEQFIFDNINNSQVTRTYVQAYGSNSYDVTISISVNFATGVITLGTVYYGTSQGTLNADIVFYE